MEVRRVVTGRTSKGKSIVARDERIAPIVVGIMPGGEFHRVWGSDDIVELPASGDPPPARGWFPPAGGFRFAFVTFPPEAPLPADADMDQLMAEVSEKLPGLTDGMEADFMHATDTIDFNLIISGEIVMRLDDGAEVLLRAGDCVIQNGTRHSWHNRSSQPCVVAAALVGARRA